MNGIGFVAIGRNEGERLKLCLASLRRESPRVVYVDSGSTDGSAEFARSLGVEVVALDTTVTFTMSRARNAGWKTLLERWPETESVHFVDGDCELIEGWVAAAAAAVAGVATYGLPFTLNILVGIAAAVVLCMALEKRVLPAAAPGEGS